MYLYDASVTLALSSLWRATCTWWRRKKGTIESNCKYSEKSMTELRRNIANICLLAYLLTVVCLFRWHHTDVYMCNGFCCFIHSRHSNVQMLIVCLCNRHCGLLWGRRNTQADGWRETKCCFTLRSECHGLARHATTVFNSNWLLADVVWRK